MNVCEEHQYLLSVKEGQIDFAHVFWGCDCEAVEPGHKPT